MSRLSVSLSLEEVRCLSQGLAQGSQLTCKRFQGRRGEAPIRESPKQEEGNPVREKPKHTAGEQRKRATDASQNKVSLATK